MPNWCNNKLILEQIQIALFAAYDMNNAMTDKDKRKHTDNDTFGESLRIIIAELVDIERQITGEKLSAADEFVALMSEV